MPHSPEGDGPYIAKPKKQPEEYLGDGVYAVFDGYHIWLDLRQQGPDKIALEPPVLQRLIEFSQRCYKAAESEGA